MLGSWRVVLDVAQIGGGHGGAGGRALQCHLQDLLGLSLLTQPTLIARPTALHTVAADSRLRLDPSVVA